MPRSEQTHTAILGALTLAPMTGYALREAIRDTLGQFWSESFGQIYPALAELERDGLVEKVDAPGARSAPYATTGRGRARLRELLAEPPQPQKPRNGTLLRLFFGRHLGPDACRTLIEQTRERAEQQLERLAAERASLVADASLGGDAPFIMMTISAGEHSARATLAWADETLAALAQLDDYEDAR